RRGRDGRSSSFTNARRARHTRSSFSARSKRRGPTASRPAFAPSCRKAPMTETLKIVEPLIEKFRRQVVDPLAGRFVDRKETGELLAITAVAGENLLLLGPPGTAKSQIVQDFAAELEGRYFECLLTRFSEPNELFGPVDLAKLKQGIVETNVEGMLP